MSKAAVWTADRLARAQDRMAELDLDGLLVTPGADLRYLAGYGIPALSRLTCLVVPVRGEPVLVVPELEADGARGCPAGRTGVAVRTWGEGDDAAGLVVAALPRAASRVALSGRAWFDHAVDLQRAFGRGPFVSGSPVLSYLRMFKAADEILAVREAAAAIDQVFTALAAGEVHVLGRTEKEVFRDVRELMLTFGHADGGGNLASGPNSASPHHKPGDRRVVEGDVLLVDVAGPLEHGYHSDCTRMFTVGRPPAGEFVACCDVVDRANAAATARAAVGVAAKEVDLAARDVITEAGYGAAFVHRTGHGIGLDVHEPPFITGENDVRLEEGMCFSVEPGIYLPGRYGVRIEDIVTITATGAERLNRTGHGLTTLTA